MEDQFTSFDPSTFSSGGTSWGDNKVRIKSAKFITETWARKDGTTGGEPSTQLEIIGVALVDDAKERRELLSVGKQAIPTLDGEGVAMKDTVSQATPYGKPIKINERSNTGKFLAALYNAGFPFSLIQDPKTGRPKISGLAGAVLTFKAEEKKDENGHAKKDKNGYQEYAYWPVAYLKDESTGGSGGATQTKTGATAPTAAASDDAQAAADVVLTVLAEVGSIARKDLVKRPEVAALSQAAKVMLIKEQFLKGLEGVKYENSTLSLA